jgi:nitric oxide reductase NorD protein
MGFDEKLFALAQRALRRALRRERDPELRAAGVSLGEIADRLRILASALARAPIEIRTAEGIGGARERTLFLPPVMRACGSPESNVELYVYRIAYGLLSMRLRSGVTRDADEAEAVLAALLAVPRTERALARSLPGSVALRARLAPAVLAHRPALRDLAPRARALAALHQARLGREVGSVLAELPAALGDWLRRMLAVEARTLRAIQEAAAQGLADLRRVARRRGDIARVDLPLWGRWMQSAPADPAPDDADALPASVDALPGGTERPSRPRESVERTEPQRRREDSPLVHVFEKVFTAEEYQGGTKNLDGSDDLLDHADALDELDLRAVTRSRETTRSLYRTDLLEDAPAADLADAVGAAGAYSYDEWDHRRRTYRRAWCTLHEAPPDRLAAAEQVCAWTGAVRARQRRAIRDLRAGFERIERARRWRNRQRDGADIDLDAVVERYALLRAGRDGDQRLYTKRKRSAPDLATAILLDGSLSTDAWVANRRVLDVAREAVFVLGEVLDAIDVRVAIGSFFSNTRRSCQYRLVKTFDERWPRAHERLLALRPTGYTRIGPALRHALHLLAREPARRKLLLLISDGKPTDYDRYEGRYGIADVRQALREAARARVHAFALAVEARARLYLPQMFGVGGYEILPDPSQLPRRLARVHQQLLRG